MKRKTLVASVFTFLAIGAVFSGCSSATTPSSTSQTSSAASTTSTTSATSTTTTTTPYTAISGEQAIAIAGQVFPAEVLRQAEIQVQLSLNQSDQHYQWDVYFDGFNTTLNALIALNWSSSEISYLVDTSDIHVANVFVDSQSGLIVRKLAGSIRLGPGPGSAPVFTSLVKVPIDTAISDEQAIAIAGQMFPTDVLRLAVIQVGLIISNQSYRWSVSVNGFDTTLDTLVAFGWNPGEISLAPGHDDVHVANILVDPQSGLILQKEATALRLILPTSIVTTFVNN
jgi:hypothetical protein